jgi:uncharacterized RDD family membrane protein YckC
VFSARTEADLVPPLADLPVLRRRQAGVRYGAWWRRAAAFVLDGVLVGAAGALVGAVPLALSSSYPAALAILSPIATLAYFTLSHGSRRGQTLGDRAVGIAVRNAADGGRATYGQAFGRTFMVMLFSGLWFLGGFVDFLWPLWDRKRQAWHDKIAGTIVVRSD